MTMIIIDTVEALELLRERGIHVARARYVDSGEDAVFFAERRPISLRVTASGNGTLPDAVETSLRTAEGIRQAYDRIAPRAQVYATGHILAQYLVDPGTEIVIEARDDALIGRLIELRCGSHHVHRLHPLTEDLAGSMLSEFRSKHGIASNEKATRMLVHLLVRVSELFGEEAIERILLDPIRLHDNTYDVMSATISAKRALPVHKRLERHAHDKKASYNP